MLHGFLKPAWQSKSAEKRRLSILKMDLSNQENQNIFIKLANEDPSQEVQLECIKKLQDPSEVFSLSETNDDITIQLAASEALALLIGPNSSITKNQLEELLVNYPIASGKLIELAPFSDLRHELLEKSNDMDLAKSIADVNYAETRCIIAEQLQDINALELARKNLKGKDKKAERVLRTKLESIRLDQKQLAINQAAADELLDNLRFIATHPQWRSEFKDRFEKIISRWSELDQTTNKDTNDAFLAFKKTTQEKVDKQTEQENIKLEQLNLLQKIESYCCGTLVHFSLKQLKDERLTINSLLAESITSWLELNNKVTSEASLSSRFLKAERALEWLTALISDHPKTALSESRWPNDYPNLSVYTEVAEQQQQQRLDLESTQASEQLAIEQLHKRLNRLMATTKQGDLRKARHELTAVSKAVEKKSGKDRVKLDERVIKAQETVQKMEDWHVFATEPKLLELCDKMENLSTTKLHADALAEQISSLQRQWKSLGHSAASDKHWPRFNKAGDVAYQPCADFFAQRKETQKDNLQKREPFIADMQSLLNDTQWQDLLDYKPIEQALKEIDIKWRSIKDVERHGGQRQWNKFKAIKEQIYAYLDPVYDANLELKQNVVAQIEQLLESDLQESALDKLKLYQSRWKQIGITRRKQDQTLWKEFKSKSDAVYDRISGLRSERKSQEDEQLEVYRGLTKQILSLAKNAASLAQLDNEFEALQQRYETLPILPKELPEKLLERLESDYRRAATNISTARDKLIENSKRHQLNQLKLKANLCSELEAAINSQANQSDIDSLKTQIDSILIDDKEWQSGIQQRLKFSEDKDKSTANEQRRRLCLELEILKGIESPNEDKALRMSMQLERMQRKGLAASTDDKSQALEKLEVNWCLYPGAEPTVQQCLQKRFENIISK